MEDSLWASSRLGTSHRIPFNNLAKLVFSFPLFSKENGSRVVTWPPPWTNSWHRKQDLNADYVKLQTNVLSTLWCCLPITGNILRDWDKERLISHLTGRSFFNFENNLRSWFSKPLPLSIAHDSILWAHRWVVIATELQL